VNACPNAHQRGCLAYCEIRDAGGSNQQAHEAAVEAVQQVLPLLSRKEASAEAVNAIAYATKYHSEWFWRGARPCNLRAPAACPTHHGLRDKECPRCGGRGWVKAAMPNR